MTPRAGFDIFITDAVGMTPSRILGVSSGDTRFHVRVGTKRGLEYALARVAMFKDAGLPTLLDINDDGKARVREDRGSMRLEAGEEYTVGAGAAAGIRLNMDIPALRPGVRAQVSDNGPGLDFLGYDGGFSVFRVVRAGVVNPGDGFVIPGVVLPVSESECLNAARAGMILGVDAVALSFVESPSIARQVARLGIRVLAKIETQTGVDNAEEIGREVDVLVAAGGDLFTNLGFRRYAAAIYQIARAAGRAGVGYCGATEIYNGVLSDGNVARSDARSLGFEMLCGAEGLFLTGTGTVHFETALNALVEQVTYGMDGDIPALNAPGQSRFTHHHQEAK